MREAIARRGRPLSPVFYCMPPKSEYTRHLIMRLTGITLHWVRVPLHEPFRISSGEVSAKDSILVELAAEGEDGLTGWGEASPMAGAFYSTETPDSTWNFLRQRLLPRFLRAGELDPRRLDLLLQEFPEEAFSRAGLEGAVWDLWANRKGRPLWALLGGESKPVPSGVAIGLMPLEELLDRVKKYRQEGYRRVKIKIEPGCDVAPVKAIRKRYGDIPLMVDANAAYKIDDLAVFQELDRFNLMMIEQPLAADALEDHAELQRRLKTPICLDESAKNADWVRKIAQLGSGRIINIKVQRVGGLSPAKQVHDAAQEAGLPCWLGAMPELGIASAQALHLGTLPNFKFPSDVEASARWYVDDMITPEIQVTNQGWIQLPEGPGMGYRVDREKIARYRIRKEEIRL